MAYGPTRNIIISHGGTTKGAAGTYRQGQVLPRAALEIVPNALVQEIPNTGGPGDLNPTVPLRNPVPKPVAKEVEVSEPEPESKPAGDLAPPKVDEEPEPTAIQAPTTVRALIRLRKPALEALAAQMGIEVGEMTVAQLREALRTILNL